MKKITDGIYLKDSLKNGNITTIMVGVHGNEFSGVEALDEIIDSLKIISGKVYFIYANLRSIKKKVRYTEKNLNRCFLKNTRGYTYEEKRAIEIMKILFESDYLLDIHNTISTNSSTEILITNHIQYSKYFDVNKIVSNIDYVHKGGSDGFMDSIGKKGFCLECGSIYFGDRNRALNLARNSIINFLKITGNINGIPKEYDINRLIIKMKNVYYSKTTDFVFAKNYKDFDLIKKGELIATDGNIKIISENTGYILFSNKPEKIGDECFCIGEEVVVKQKKLQSYSL